MKDTDGGKIMKLDDGSAGYLSSLLLGDVAAVVLDAELPLRPGQDHPQLAPLGELLLLRKVVLHLRGRVARVEGALVRFPRVRHAVSAEKMGNGS